MYKRYKKLTKNNHYNNKKANKVKNSYITKLFLRIFLSSFLLLAIVVSDRYDKFVSNKVFKNNINYLKMTNIITGLFNDTYKTSSINVDANINYEKIEFIDSKNIISDSSSNLVYSIENAIVIKIKKHNGLYDIVLQTEDDYLFCYYGLAECHVNIYEFVLKNTTIGLSNNILNKNVFELIIEKEGKYYEYYDI